MKFYAIFQKKWFHHKILQKMPPENWFQGLLYLQRFTHNIYWKMKFLRQATYMRYVIPNPCKLAQISTQVSIDCFLQRIFSNLKGTWNYFPGHTFHRILWWKSYLQMLHILAIFHYQAVFASQVIQQNGFNVSCLRIWWHHEFEYLKI